MASDDDQDPNSAASRQPIQPIQPAPQPEPDDQQSRYQQADAAADAAFAAKSAGQSRPAGLAPAPGTVGADFASAREKVQSDLSGRAFDDPNAAPPVYRQEAEKASDRQEVENQRLAKEQALTARDQSNSDREAQMRSSGQQYFKDANGNIQPIIDPSGQALYHESPWTVGTNPQTKGPALQRRNAFGKTEYKQPKIVANPDPNDDQLYYQMPDGTTVAAGKAADMVNSKDFPTARLAMKAVHDQRAQTRKDQIFKFQSEAQQAGKDYGDATKQQADLRRSVGANGEIDQQIAAIKADPSFNGSADGAPTNQARQLQAQVAVLEQTKQHQTGDLAYLDSLVMPGGDLDRQRRLSNLNLGIQTLTQQDQAYNDRIEARTQYLKQIGGNPATDPQLALISQNRQILQQEVAKQTGVAKQFTPSGVPLGASLQNPSQTGVEPGAVPPAGAPATQPAASATPASPTPTAAFPGEPSDMEKQGIQSVGNVSVGELARRYGDGTGTVKPLSLLKLAQRSKDIAATLDDPKTSLDATTQKGLADEKAYIDQLAATRFAKLPGALQKRVTELTRDPTYWEKAKAIGTGIARGAAQGLVDTGEFGAREYVNSSPLLGTLAPKTRDAALSGVERGAQALREQTDNPNNPIFSATKNEQVEQKLRQGTLTGTLPELAGQMLPFVAGGDLAGAGAKAAGLSEKTAAALSRLTTTFVGGAQGGNSMRRQAIDTLKPDLESGKITKQQYTRGVGLAELLGTGVGAAGTELGPMSKFAQRIGGLATGKNFMSSLLDKAGSSGTTGALRWLAGEGGKKALADVVREGTQSAGVGFAQTLANDLAAKASFDPNRKIDLGKAGTEAAKMGLVGTLAGALTHAMKPAESPPGSTEPPPPNTKPGAPTEPVVGPTSPEAARTAAVKAGHTPDEVSKMTDAEVHAALSNHLDDVAEAIHATPPTESAQPTKENATAIPGEEPRNDQQEHQRVPQGTDLRKDGEQVRSEDRPAPGSGGGAVERAKDDLVERPAAEVKAGPQGATDGDSRRGTTEEAHGAEEKGSEGVQRHEPEQHDAESIAALSPEGFRDYARGAEGGFTTQAEKMGRESASNPDEIANLEKGHASAQKEFAAAEPGSDDQSALASKVQFFSEALQSAKKASAEAKPEATGTPGWDAFPKEQGGLGIPRAEMPQVDASHRGALVHFLRGQGISHEAVEVKPTDLKPTQAEYSPEKVAGARAHEGGDRSIVISSDGHVLDGHHQWLARLQDKPNEPIKAIRFDAPIKDLVEKTKEFPSATVAAGATKPEAAPMTEQPPASSSQTPAAGDTVETPATQATPEAGGKPAESQGPKSRIDQVIDRLEKAKISKPGRALGDPIGFALAHDGAIEVAIAALKASKSVAEAVKAAIAHLKEKFPGATSEQQKQLADTVREAHGEEEKQLIRDQIDEGKTSTKNAVVEAEREKRNLPPGIQSIAREFKGTVWKEATEEMKRNLERGQQLVDEINDPRRGPRTLKDTERAIILHHQNTLQNDYDSTANHLFESVNGDTFSDQASLREHAAAVLDKLHATYDALKASGSEAGRSLNAIKMAINRDYSLTSLLTKLRVAKGGGRLTPEENASVEALSAKIEATQKAFDDYRSKTDDHIAGLEMDKTVMQMLRDVKDAARAKAPRSVVSKFFDDQADAARKRVMERLAGGQMNDVTSLAAHFKDLAIIGAQHLKNGVRDFAGWSSEMLKDIGNSIKPHLERVFNLSQDAEKVLQDRAGTTRDTKAERKSTVDKMKEKLAEGSSVKDLSSYVHSLALQFVSQGVTGREPLIDAVHGTLKEIDPEITRREAMDAISGYGKFQPLDKDTAKTTLRGLKGEMQQIGKVQDMSANQAPQKTGVERRVPTPEERSLIKVVNEMKRKGGFTVTDPATQLKSALEGVKTRLRNGIEDMEHQIATRQQTVKGKTDVARDQEAKDLQTRHDALKKEYDQIFQKPDLTDAQRMELASKALDRQIAEVHRQLKDNELFAPSSAPKLSSPAIDAKRATLDALKEEREHARHLVQPQSEPADAAAKKVQALDRQIAAIHKQIKEGRLFSKGQAVQPDSPEIQARQAELAKLKQERENARQTIRGDGTDFQSKNDLALQAYKTRIAKQIEDLQTRIANGDTERAKRQPLEMDPQARELQATAQRAKLQFDRLALAKQRDQRGFWAKAAEQASGAVRLGALSRIGTIGKLAALTPYRMIETPLKELASQVTLRLPVVGKAIRASEFERPGSVAAIAKFYTTFAKQGFREAYNFINKGETDAGSQYGKRDIEPPHWYDFFQGLHKAIKTPLITAAHEYYTQKGIEAAIQDGANPNDPLTMGAIRARAYQYAQRMALQERNKVAEGYTSQMGKFQKLNPDGTLQDPKGYYISHLLESAFTKGIVKTPLNHASQAIEMTPLGGAYGAARMLTGIRKGFADMSPEQRNAMARLLNTGGIGAAAMAYGMYDATKDAKDRVFGGYFEPGEKRDPNDAAFGSMRIGGHQFGRWSSANPAATVAQMGSTLMRVFLRAAKDQDKQNQPKNLQALRNLVAIAAPAIRAGLSTGGSLLSEGPIGSTVGSVGKLADPSENQRAIMELLGSQIPSIIPEETEFYDKHVNGVEKRFPRDGVDSFAMNIPGLRQQVPTQPKATGPRLR